MQTSDGKIRKTTITVSSLILVLTLSMNMWGCSVAGRITPTVTPRDTLEASITASFTPIPPTITPTAGPTTETLGITMSIEQVISPVTLTPNLMDLSPGIYIVDTEYSPINRDIMRLNTRYISLDGTIRGEWTISWPYEEIDELTNEYWGGSIDFFLTEIGGTPAIRYFGSAYDSDRNSEYLVAAVNLETLEVSRWAIRILRPGIQGAGSYGVSHDGRWYGLGLTPHIGRGEGVSEPYVIDLVTNTAWSIQPAGLPLCRQYWHGRWTVDNVLYYYCEITATSQVRDVLVCTYSPPDGEIACYRGDYDPIDSFSPDGSHVLMNRPRTFNPEGPYSEPAMYILDRSCMFAEECPRLEHPFCLGSILCDYAWDPTGRYLTLTNKFHGDSSTDLLVIDVERGEEVHRRDNVPGLWFVKSWSPDGEWVLYSMQSSTDHGIKLYSPESGIVRPVDIGFTIGWLVIP
ncbi:MAG: hypothetical protein ABIJ39_08295 [Chloroflexota bacterium]